MLLFILFGIFFFPNINAEEEDEIKIYQNKSINWIRYCEKETVDGCKNTEMKYIIDSPHTSAIGKLVKKTKIEGCQHIGGCGLVLQLGTVSI